jgi:hypothetical protein
MSCERLSSVAFASDSKLVRIGDAAFRYCTALASIYMPSSVETIGKTCFGGCSALSSVIFEDNSKPRKQPSGFYAKKENKGGIEHIYLSDFGGAACAPGG